MSDKMREAFEDWYRSVHDPVDVPSFGHASGEYTDGYIQVAYLAWQAALAQQGEQEPMGYAVIVDGEGEEIGFGPSPLPDDPSIYLLYTRPQPATIPEGWVLVPVDPTTEMLQAAFNASVPAVWVDSISGQQAVCDAAKYRAMLAAAPEQPTAPAEQWVSCSERLPTAADADDSGMVWAWQPNTPKAVICGVSTAIWNCAAFTDAKKFGVNPLTHWMPTNLKRPAPPEDHRED